MKQGLKILLPTAAIIIFIWVVSVPVRAAGGFDGYFRFSQVENNVYQVMRLGGLALFVLVSYQTITGSFVPLFSRLYGPRFYRYNAVSGVTVLVLALAHLSLFIYFLNKLDFFEGFLRLAPWQFFLGPVAFLLIMAVGIRILWAVLSKRQTLASVGGWVYWLNYLIFVFGFVHSIRMGSDIALSSLRILWLIFAGLAAVGLVYRLFGTQPRKDKAGGRSKTTGLDISRNEHARY